MGQPRALAFRIVVASLVLASFMATSLALTAVLGATPFAILYFGGENVLRAGGIWIAILFAACWVPAALLARGLLRARPARFVAPCPALRREDAPALFSLVDELARAAATPPPSSIYLTAFMELAVTETGGVLGIGSRRVLCIGAPLLASVDVSQLRAGLAHELGHFAGGDTRLCGVLGFTESLLGNVLAATSKQGRRSHGWFIDVGYDVGDALGRGLVRLFATIYLRLTRPAAQRQELLADRLAVALAGREATRALLDDTHVLGPLYSGYLAGEVSAAIDVGVMPTDLLAGFDVFRRRCDERGITAKVAQGSSDKKPDPFDTHPSLAERRALVDAAPDAGPPRSTALARGLLSASFDLDAHVVEATWARVSGAVRPVRRAPWADYVARELPATLAHESAEARARTAWALRDTSSATATFAELLAAYAAGWAPPIVSALEPRLAHLPELHRAPIGQSIAGRLLAAAFHGALLERGARVEAILGEPCPVFVYEGERVDAADVATRAMVDGAARATLEGWAARLARDAAPEVAAVA